MVFKASGGNSRRYARWFQRYRPRLQRRIAMPPSCWPCDVLAVPLRRGELADASDAMKLLHGEGALVRGLQVWPAPRPGLALAHVG